MGFDVHNPRHRARAADRLAVFGLQGGREERATGIAWYPTANRIVRAEALMDRITAEQAAAIASVLSPGSDWSARNIPAVTEAVQLSEREWDLIADAQMRAVRALSERRARGEAGRWERPQRSLHIADLLAWRAPSLGMQTDRQLLKARSILRGHHPDVVIPRATSPKTNAFYRAIFQPYHAQPVLPIDYRMADLIANEMRIRETERRIDYDRPLRYDSNGQFLRRAAPSAYRRHEQIIARAGQIMAERGGRGFQAFRRPITAQAYLWVLAKSYEQSLPGAKQSRQRPGEMFSGPPRRGQPYTTSTGQPWS